MKHIAILIAVTLVLGTSCSRSPAPRKITTQEDVSLTPVEYMDLGFPASDRPWTTPDYQVVFRTMQTLPVERLPRTTSPKSCPVVDRLTNPDNLGFFVNRTLPLDQRLVPCIDLVDSANGISKLYLAAHSRAPVFAEDIIRMQGFMLQAVVVELRLLDEFLPTLDKSDPSYPTRMAGLEQMKSGMAQMIQGVLVVLAERKSYTAKARAEFASTVSATFPKIAPHLPPLSRQEFTATLRRIASEEKDTSVKASILTAIQTQ